ncbi:transglutaminase domain-containing protein [Streptomyces sp. NPDC056987]|uniref:transglutaminase domain-containing protein n=1 Tax=Streptomyces sp. NPDC056987 TaxID=3345988 RepID=UPI003633D10B
MPGEESLCRVVGRLRRIPDGFREFTQTGSDAGRRHGIHAELLDALVVSGLPYRATGAGPRFDGLDLANVSLGLALPSPRFMAMRGWSAAIRSAAHAAAVTYVVTVEPSCPKDSHPGLCSAEPAPHLRQLPGYRASSRGAFTLTRRVHGQTAHVRSDVTRLTDLVQPLHFHLLPDGLRADLGFLRETRLADCGLAARHLVAEAAALGLRARRSFGLFISAPYSIPHAWFDLYLNDAWVPFDPHLLNVLTGWDLLRPGEWPPHRSIGDAAWRLGEDEFMIATHIEGVAALSFPTRADGT